MFIQVEAARERNRQLEERLHRLLKETETAKVCLEHLDNNYCIMLQIHCILHIPTGDFILYAREVH